jgi:hypothetical protein
MRRLMGCIICTGEYIRCCKLDLLLTVVGVIHPSTTLLRLTSSTGPLYLQRSLSQHRYILGRIDSSNPARRPSRLATALGCSFTTP